MTTGRAAALAATLALTAALASAADPTPFDGDWTVTMTCPPHLDDDDDAKGYTHRFAARVEAGRLSATHGREGEPGWHFLRGPIKADGSATLRLDGIVHNPKYAINGAPEGKPYSYRVKAQFDATSGRGQRLTGRVCEFRFER